MNQADNYTNNLEQIIGQFNYRGCIVKKDHNEYSVFGIKTLTLKGVDEIINNAGIKIQNSIVSSANE